MVEEEDGNLSSITKLITSEKVHNHISKNDQSYSKSKHMIRYLGQISAVCLAPTVLKEDRYTCNQILIVQNLSHSDRPFTNQKPTNTSNI